MRTNKPKFISLGLLFLIVAAAVLISTRTKYHATNADGRSIDVVGPYIPPTLGRGITAMGSDRVPFPTLPTGLWMVPE